MNRKNKSTIKKKLITLLKTETFTSHKGGISDHPLFPVSTPQSGTEKNKSSDSTTFQSKD